MSELEDKPEPAAAKPGADTSRIDSDWDALLGSASTSASNRPIFAPPGAAKKKPVSGPVPDAAPRTSQAGASVSGEFEAAEPRPEPATPPRYEPPDGVIEEPLHPLPDLLQAGPPTQDDDRETPNDPPPVLTLVHSAEPADDPPPPPDDVVERPRARAPEPAEQPPEPRPGGSGKLLWIVGAIAAVVAIVVLVGDREDQPTVSSTTEQPTERTDEPPARDPEPGVDERPAVATETGTDEGETGGGETGGEPEPKPTAKPSTDDPRDPSLIPPGTPDENAKAFLKLPVSIHDGPPVGGIGRSGVHIDAITTARGRDNTSCDQPTSTFSISVAEYVNVCFRVVHPREQESLRVIWEKDGKVTRRGRVRIPDLHAYTTRAYLLVRPEYVGRWRVRIVPDGEEAIDLAVAEFEITE